MDPKVTYIAKTLSRTKRKDYENYVVNAIWNRVNNAGLVPVTQQYVRDRDGNRFFIDMYFPQLKIGIECDEGYHTDKDQKIRDAERELTINDVLTQVDGGDYIALHVDVTRSFDEVEAQI
ncbi:MAG: restriction endonuclease, partial [Clostridia bacterium]|nr:restriction endonuclease [Clostridia bacterium]